VDSQGGDAALIQAIQEQAALQVQLSGRRNDSSEETLQALLGRAAEESSSSSFQTPVRGEIPGTKTPASPGLASPQVSATPSATTGTTRTVPPPGLDNVDSVVLVYDLDRVETFFRLENHWLPLIERCYNGKVSQKYSAAWKHLPVFHLSNLSWPLHYRFP
jgi:Ras family protein T1